MTTKALIDAREDEEQGKGDWGVGNVRQGSGQKNISFGMSSISHYFSMIGWRKLN